MLAMETPDEREFSYHLRVGQTYEGLVVLRVIGHGGFGQVYLVSDAEGRRWALKLFVPVDRKDRKSAHRFLVEAQILRRIQSPHLVRCEGHGQAVDGTLWILLEYLPGNTLRHELDTADRGYFPMERVLRVGMQLATVLEVVHAHGVVHRDIKPENAILTPADLLKLLDFGVAKAQGVHLRTTRNVHLGTGLYMAPDRLTHRGEDASPLWDLYSVGVMMWEQAAGRHPFHRKAGEQLTDAEVIHKHMGNEIPWLAEVTGYPEEVCAPIMRACAGDPRERFQSAAELREALGQTAQTWRELSTERVSVLGTNVTAKTKTRLGAATTEPSFTLALPAERPSFPPATAPPNGAAPGARLPSPADSRWPKTEPVSMDPGPESGVLPFTPRGSLSPHAPRDREGRPWGEGGRPPEAPRFVSTGTERIMMPEDAVPARGRAIQQMAPIPPAHVLRELGRPGLTADEERLTAGLDPIDQRWRVLFLRYLDTLPPDVGVDMDRIGGAISEHLDAEEPAEDTGAPGGNTREHRGSAPASARAQRVPVWALVVAGVLAGVLGGGTAVGLLVRRSYAPPPSAAGPVTVPMSEPPASVSEPPVSPSGGLSGPPTGTATAAVTPSATATTTATATATPAASTAGPAQRPASPRAPVWKPVRRPRSTHEIED